MAEDTKDKIQQNSLPLLIQLFICLLVFVAVGLIYYIVWGTGETLKLLSNADIARGFITYTIALGAVLIGLILTLGALFGSGDSKDNQFERGKQIFTLLVGILGTIIGYYYGAETGDKTIPEIQLTAPVISKAKPAAGETVTLATTIKGGAPPYKLILSFKDNRLPTLVKPDNNEGPVKVSVPIPKGTKEGPVSFVIDVLDSQGAGRTYSSDPKALVIEKPKKIKKKGAN